MPSRAPSRTTTQPTTATVAPVAGPAVVVRPSLTQAILADPAPIQAVVGAPFAAEAAAVRAHAQAVPTASFVPDIEDPAVDTPEWADIYPRSVGRHRDERERIDLAQAAAQQPGEQVLEAPGSASPDGEG